MTLISLYMKLIKHTFIKQAGPDGGDIIMIPQGNGTVFIGQTDMLKLFEVLTVVTIIHKQ